jgi:cytochrome c oxidase assembly factor CtaG
MLGGLNYDAGPFREEAMPRSAHYQLGGPGRSAFRGIAWVGGAIAWVAAAVTGAVLALVFAASLVVILFMAAVLVAFAATAARARRTVRAPADPDLIEARNIGGHSWIAYGWDGRR